MCIYYIIIQYTYIHTIFTLHNAFHTYIFSYIYIYFYLYIYMYIYIFIYIDPPLRLPNTWGVWQYAKPLRPANPHISHLPSPCAPAEPDAIHDAIFWPGKCSAREHGNSDFFWVVPDTQSIHPGRLSWNLRIHPCKRKSIFQTIIFRFYDNLPGCMYHFWAGSFSERFRVAEGESKKIQKV